jgi:ABC-type transport system substrate-binding protein
MELRHARPTIRRVLAALVIGGTAGTILTAQGAAAAGPGQVDLKKAVNYAIDRQAMLDQRGAHAGVTNDQILPPDFPGFSDAALYPPRPDVPRARELARWRPGDPMRHAVMYTCNTGPCIPTAQIVQANLAEIGIAVEIQPFPRAVQFTKTATRGEPFDLTLEGWHMDYYDPYDFLFLLDGRTIGPSANANHSYFDDPGFNQQLAGANQLAGQARIDALGVLDSAVMANLAPIATFLTDHDRQFFSKRIGCHVYNGATGSMLLAELCLRAGEPPDDVFHWLLDTDIDYVDPALAYYVISWQIEQATCARLVNYPPLPGEPGRRLQPEIALGMPTVSPDGRTYTFTLRDDFKFAPSGEQVRPEHFKHAIERALDPRMAAPAQSFFAGIQGIEAVGNTLRITLANPDGTFLARMAMPFACPLPLSVQVNPDGIGAPVPSAGAYYVKTWTPKQQIVLERNPYYPGDVPHFQTIDVSIGLPLATIRLEVESGNADYGPVPPSAHAELAEKYGPNSEAAKAGRQQWFANPAAAIRYLALNHDRPLFGTSPPSPPPSAPPPAAPPPRRTLASAALVSRTVAVTSRGIVPLRIRCGGATCRGNVALFAPAGTRGLTARRPVKLGQARFSIARGKTKTVRVPLSARGFKALKRAKRLKAQVVVTLVQANRRKSIKRSTVVLKAPRRR